MDSSKRETQNQLEAIKQLVLDGRLTQSQICDALTGEIKKQLQKSTEEVDLDYITACQRLIESLNHEKASRMESHADRNFATVQGKLRRNKHPARSRKRVVVRYVFAAACLLGVLLGMDVLFMKRSIDTGYSPDEEQIIYDGTMIKPRIMEMAGADIAQNEIQELTTTDWREVVDFLGYEPDMPMWIPDGWTLHDYGCAIFETYAWFAASYAHEDTEELLQYSIEHYSGSERLHGTYEQDGVGYEMTVSNGEQLYVTTNMGSHVIFWHDNTELQTIVGPISTVSVEEMIRMVESMNKSE